MTHSNQLNHSIASMGKMLLLTTSLMLLVPLSNFGTLYASEEHDQQKEGMRVEAEKPQHEEAIKVVSWKKSLRDLNQALHADFIHFLSGSQTLDFPIQKMTFPLQKALKVMEILTNPTGEGIPVGLEIMPSHDDIEVILNSIYHSALVIFFSSFQNGSSTADSFKTPADYLEYIVGIKRHMKDYFGVADANEQDASFKRHRLIVHALYAKAFHMIAQKYFPDHADTYAESKFLPTEDTEIFNKIKSKLDFLKSKMDNIPQEDYHSALARLQVNEETVKKITPRILANVYDAINNDAHNWNSLMSEEQVFGLRENAGVKGFANMMTPYLQSPKGKDDPFSKSLSNFHSLYTTRFKVLNTALASLSLGSGNLTKDGIIDVHEKIKIADAIRDKNYVPPLQSYLFLSKGGEYEWYVLLSASFKRWAATVHKIQRLLPKKHDSSSESSAD